MGTAGLGDVGSHLPLLPTQARQQFRAPQVQQRFPPLKNTPQKGEKAQPGKISSKETSKEIASRLPRAENGRTMAPPAEIAVPT